MQIAREKLNLAVVERDIDRTELYAADEAFFCGTGIEVVPIVSVDRLNLGDGKPGAVTQRVQTVYHDIVRGIDESYAEWRTTI
jgi:branched-chain amino acid aminotransferase